MREIIVALAGNPNSGKSTVFNALTGSRQHIGNYPGVTVEKKEGVVKREGATYRIVDLPGTYSLSASSPEEVVARDFLVNDKPDVVIQVVDASNMERNLYLAVQLMELGAKLVFALNMSDVAKARGIEFDLEKIADLIKAPVIPTVGSKKIGMDALLDAVALAVENPAPGFGGVHYPQAILDAVDKIDRMLSDADRSLAAKYPEKWLSARALENDSDIMPRLETPGMVEMVRTVRDAFNAEVGDPPEITMAESRYGWISGLCAESVKTTVESRLDMSDRIDSVVLNRILGLPIFLILMYLVFQLVFTLAEPPMGWIETAFGDLGEWVKRLWPKAADSPLRDLIVDGVIGGMGGVLVFLPNIILLFLAIAFLEGTGYMARAAFLMDRLMHKIGLHGKSFIPMLLGFGCTVPAIMGARTLENRKDRLTTILVLPFMSCGARLPIYSLIIPAFFPEALRAWMLWLIYVIGVVFAILGAKLLRSVVFTGESVPFVMELPPYRMPTLRAVMILMWERAGEYCKKAGTIILGVSIVLWAMTAYPRKEVFDRDYDAEREAARAALIEDVSRLGRELGLDGGGASLASWQEARLEKAEAGEAYWEFEPGFAKGEAEYGERVAALYAAPGGDRLKAFAEAAEAIGAIEDEFIEATGEVEEESSELAAAMRERDASIEALGLDPALLAAVRTYRDEVVGGYDVSMEEIDNEQEGEEIAGSISGHIGKFLEPVVRPLGFDWRVATAIIGSFAAKEVFVAQMGIVYSVGEADEESETLRAQLSDNYTPLQGFCMMLWGLLSLPCVVTIAVARRETGGWKYAVWMIVGFTAVAYATTFIVYQAGCALGIGV